MTLKNTLSTFSYQNYYTSMTENYVNNPFFFFWDKHNVPLFGDDVSGAVHHKNHLELKDSIRNLGFIRVT